MRVHRIGFENGYRYTPPTQPNKRDRDGLTRAQAEMYARLKHQIREVSAVDMGKKLKITTNHAGMLLGELFKQGLVIRRRVTANGTRYFMYQVKDKT